jgi:SAM-dependent methyltransferase
MSDPQREQVRDTAKYLRNVRPIDPEEIYEYVDDRPHPAVVREHLREMAFDLGLREREDGTFVPAPEGPVSVAFDGVTALPERHVRALEDLLIDAFGPGWPDSEAGDRLRERIRSVKAAYLGQEHVEYDRETALGYAVYHLPAYYAAAQYLLADLARDGHLPSQLRVLDVGAGVGGPLLGIADLLPAETIVEYHALEPSAAADVLEELTAETRRNFRVEIHRERAETFDPDREYDVVLCANVLSELADPGAVVERYRDALAADGSVVALAPADKNTATQLRSIERALEDGFTVYAPTVRLWPGATPGGNCWSFDVKPDLDVPPFQRRLDAAASDPDHEPGEFENVDVQYAFSILRTDGARRIDVTPSRDRYARMADAEAFVTDRVNLLAIKLSHDLSGADANPLFLVGDGSERRDHFAVVTRESTLNRDVIDADYGDLLSFENVLVLWNDDERAYNLVVDDETIVDAVPT